MEQTHVIAHTAVAPAAPILQTESHHHLSLILSVDWLLTERLRKKRKSRLRSKPLDCVALRDYGGQKIRKKTAIMAVARKLLVCCWTMLKHQQPWHLPKIQAAAG